jgi:hypothetical protein
MVVCIPMSHLIYYLDALEPTCSQIRFDLLARIDSIKSESKSSSNHQAIIKQSSSNHQAIIKQSSSNHQAIINQSSINHQ